MIKNSLGKPGTGYQIYTEFSGKTITGGDQTVATINLPRGAWSCNGGIHIPTTGAANNLAVAISFVTDSMAATRKGYNQNLEAEGIGTGTPGASFVTDILIRNNSDTDLPIYLVAANWSGGSYGSAQGSFWAIKIGD